MWDAGNLYAEPGHVGLTGSHTIVIGLAEAPYREPRREFLTGSPEQVVQELVKVLREEV